jgi:hypothetical protein
VRQTGLQEKKNFELNRQGIDGFENLGKEEDYLSLFKVMDLICSN